MNQISEDNLNLLVDILNDESPYHVGVLDRLEKEIVSYCDEYATHLARLQVLRPEIVRRHTAYTRLGGGTLREYNRLELAAPAPALETGRAVIEAEAVSLAAEPSQVVLAASAPVSQVPAASPRKVRKYSRKPKGSQLSLDEYVTFVNMVKQEFGVYPPASTIAQYYQATMGRVWHLKYEAVRIGRLPHFVSPSPNPKLLGKITETFGPYELQSDHLVTKEVV
jgi:hypothetical protein